MTIYSSRHEGCDPNPILVNFRGVKGAKPRLWLYMVQSDLIDPDDWISSGYSVAHLEHAERVFKKMVSVYEGGIK